MKIPHPVVRLLGSVAETAAADVGVPMAIAFADEEGSLQYFLRMEGALPASTEIAQNKAYTAAALRMPTGDLGRLSLPGETLYGIQNTQGGRIILFGGGVPLLQCRCVAGAVGISGGTVEEDVRVAGAVVRAFEAMASLAEIFQTLAAATALRAECPTVLERRVREALRDFGEPFGRDLSDLLVGGLLLAIRGR